MGNRGMCTIKGTDMISPHGIPIDLLDRLLIIRTLPYVPEEMMQIMHIRASVEGLSVDESGIAALAEIGSQTSLRYVGQLLTPARVLAVTNGKDVITKSEIDEVAAMFRREAILGYLAGERREIYLMSCLNEIYLMNLL